MYFLKERMLLADGRPSPAAFATLLGRGDSDSGISGKTQGLVALDKLGGREGGRQAVMEGRREVRPDEEKEGEIGRSLARALEGGRRKRRGEGAIS